MGVLGLDGVFVLPELGGLVVRLGGRRVPLDGGRTTRPEPFGETLDGGLRVDPAEGVRGAVGRLTL